MTMFKSCPANRCDGCQVFIFLLLLFFLSKMLLKPIFPLSTDASPPKTGKGSNFFFCFTVANHVILFDGVHRDNKLVIGHYE